MKALTGVKLPQLHPFTWASGLLKEGFCSETDRSVFIIGMHALWLQRNKHRHGADQLPLKKIVQWTVNLAHDLWQLTKPVQQLATSVSKPRWTAPPVGSFKCNFDGAFHPDLGQGANGAVIRDLSRSLQRGQGEMAAIRT